MALEVEIDGGVCRIVINRPEADNRVDRATCLGITEALRAADVNTEVKAAVLTATGKRFCIGGQVDGAADGAAADQIAFADAFGGVHLAAAAFSKPLIAGINGDALAGGFSLMSSCDLAITVDTAKFGLPELGAGLFPMLALATSVHLLPRKVLFDLIYNQRLLTAQEALQYGLVNAVVPAPRFQAALTEQVTKLSTMSSVAIALGRRAYHAMLDMPRADAIAHGGLSLVQLLATEDGRGAVRAHAKGEQPVWTGR